MSIQITSTAEWFRCIGPTATLQERPAALAKLRPPIGRRHHPTAATNFASGSAYSANSPTTSGSATAGTNDESTFMAASATARKNNHLTEP
jgi:hypothetical protein